jgi:hypothetical protein
MIESSEKTLCLEKDYCVNLTIPMGLDYPLEWYFAGNNFKLNEGGKVVGEGVILGDVCFD